MLKQLKYFAMKRLVSIFGLLFFSTITFSQVGINTTDPKAQLEIKSSNQATPSNKDGILIPKINAFPLINPTVDQNSMMVYLTLDLPGKPKGFYYWNNDTTTWVGFIGDKGWELTGNSGTNPSTNFIGTTDDNDVVFKRNNIASGILNSSNNNTSFGVSALNSLNTGGRNTAVGKEALAANTIGFNNTSVGSDALATNTTGYHNTAFGTFALNLNDGDFNTAVGQQALSENTLGDFNVALGNQALSSNKVGSRNTAVGSSSIYNNTTGEENTSVGSRALFNNVAGSKATAIGRDAMYNANNTTTAFDNQNVAVGYEALKGSPTPADNTGNSNTAIGYQTLLNNSEGRENVAVGTNALQANEIAIQNTAVGVNALKSLIGGGDDSGSFNVAVGFNTLTNNEYGTFNTAIGSYSLEDNVNGSANIAMGYFALRNTTAHNNIAIGKDAMESNDAGSKGIAIGTSAMANLGNTTTPFENLNVAIGYESLKGSSVFADNTGNSNTAVGYQTLLNNAKGSDNSVFGTNALKSNTNASGNIAIGKNTLFSQNFINAGAEYESGNTAIGLGALYNTNSTTNSNGRYNIGIGRFALSNNATGSSNIALGNSALGGAWTGLGTMTGDGNIAIGGAAIKSISTGSNNIALGSLSLNYNSVGAENISIGKDALFYSTAQSGGTVIGTRAMQNYGITSTPGTNDNVAIGYEAMRGNASSMYNQNTALGYQSMTAIVSGSNNTANGYQSLFSNVSGAANTAFGDGALRTNISGSNNIAIGYQAGYSETGSNKLYIENSNSATPLIYGEFDNDLIRINGRTESIYTQLTANNDGQSSIYGYRTRDSQNDGTNYSRTGTNKAISGYNLWGDLYTFGVTGHCYNDYTRTGGVLGADISGTYWSSLGYKNSAFTTYGVYATAVLATGTGRLAQPQNEFSIGGGFYGGIIGSWSKGTAIGHVASGSLFASYNSGNEYTAGKQIELVDTGNSKIAAYTVTSTESIIYKKGKITLTNGSARVNFDKNYTNLLGDIPIVTTTPMGQCNGLYIESIDKDGFVIKELNNGTSNVPVSWIAVGDRVDANTNTIAESILNKDFDQNINQVMFNENNKSQSAKAVWTDGNTIQFGELPENLKQKNTTKKE